jgi:hypothetical protein
VIISEVRKIKKKRLSSSSASASGGTPSRPISQQHQPGKRSSLTASPIASGQDIPDDGIEEFLEYVIQAFPLIFYQFSLIYSTTNLL